MYRGQDIGDPQRFRQRCIQVLEEGRVDRIQEILPHLSILRDAVFLPSLLRLLDTGSLRQRELAAIALGGLGHPGAISALMTAFRRAVKREGQAGEAVQTATILALGEIGDAGAVRGLVSIFQIDDDLPFTHARKRLVLCALGILAQQGADAAARELTKLLKGKDRRLRVEALRELAVAYWHRADEVPEPVLYRMKRLTQDPRPEIREEALAALATLADLGCREAGEFLRRT